MSQLLLSSSAETINLRSYKALVTRLFQASSQFRSLVLSEPDIISKNDWIAILPLLDRLMITELSSR